jgi:hypothetical protein
MWKRGDGLFSQSKKLLIYSFLKVKDNGLRMGSGTIGTLNDQTVFLNGD